MDDSVVHKNEEANRESTTPEQAGVEGAFPQLAGLEFLGLIGQGGMGRVYKARQTGIGRMVAVKVLTKEHDVRLRDRFLAEIRAVGRLNHPHITRVYEHGAYQDCPYYTMELVEGISLAQKIAGKPQDPRFAAEITQIIARAIHYSHDQGILHRDLKPANILLNAEEFPKVTDFGLAKEWKTIPGKESDPLSPGGLTQTGEVMGTPNYMAPEQASGIVAKIGPGADIYSLGSVLYELLTGRPPFQSPDIYQMVTMVLVMDPVAPRLLQPSLPRDLETICLKCLEKSPKKRYLTANDLAGDLARFLKGEPIQARPVGRLEKTLKWARRNPWRAVSVGLTISILATLTILSFFIELKNRELIRKNGELAIALKESEALLQVSLRPAKGFVFEIANRLNDIPKTESLRGLVLEEAKNLLMSLDQIKSRRDDVRNYLMVANNKLGQAQMLAGFPKEAAISFGLAHNTANGLLADHPENLTHLINSLGAGWNEASCLEKTGELERAGQLRFEAERNLQILIKEMPRDRRVIELGKVVYQRGLLEADSPEKLESLMRSLLNLKLAHMEIDPDSDGPRIEASDSALDLAYNLATRGQLGEADSNWTKASSLLDSLSDRSGQLARKLAAKCQETRGALDEARKDHLKADREYRQAVSSYRKLGTDFSQIIFYRDREALVWMAISRNASIAGKNTEAIEAGHQAVGILEELVKKYPGESSIANRLELFKKLNAGLPGRNSGGTPPHP